MALEDLIQKFCGKWKNEKTENVEEYYKIMDLNIVVRKLITKFNPTEEIKVEDDYVVTIANLGPLSAQSKYKFNEEFKEDRMGIKMKSICRYEDGKMIIKSTAVNKPELKPQTVTIEKIDDDTRLTTIVVGDNDLECKRYYKRVLE